MVMEYIVRKPACRRDIVSSVQKGHFNPFTILVSSSASSLDFTHSLSSHIYWWIYGLSQILSTQQLSVYFILVSIVINIQANLSQWRTIKQFLKWPTDLTNVCTCLWLLRHLQGSSGDLRRFLPILGIFLLFFPRTFGLSREWFVIVGWLGLLSGKTEPLASDT